MGNKPDEEIELLRGTMQDLAESITRIKEQRDRLNVELAAKEERLFTWNSRLGRLLSEQVDSPVGAALKTRRRRKGENSGPDPETRR